uniref:Major facilitator superfamily (MFS) profile domain-containing protein n=1 Tax=Timema genevievae TaxID=629358 RepID=A0A7R9PN48_TIMGE|nr:unnamed protein product [Timema genevievae]
MNWFQECDLFLSRLVLLSHQTGARYESSDVTGITHCHIEGKGRGRIATSPIPVSTRLAAKLTPIISSSVIRVSCDYSCLDLSNHQFSDGELSIHVVIYSCLDLSCRATGTIAGEGYDTKIDSKACDRETGPVARTLLFTPFTIAATVAAHGNSISVGLCQGFSAVLIPQLMNSTSTIQITEEESSWIASLGVISNPLGALSAGILMEIFGRKTTVKMTSLPYLVGWILIALSDNIVKMYVGRFISGLAVGMATASYVYVAEISQAEHRGTLSAAGPIHVSFGVLAVYILGYIAKWQLVAAVCTVCAVLSFLAMCMVPESPPWLASQGRVGEAKAALVWLGRSPSSAEAELDELLDSEVGTGLNEFVASIIVGGVRLVMSIVGTILIRNFGRKTLAVASGIGMGPYIDSNQQELKECVEFYRSLLPEPAMSTTELSIWESKWAKKDSTSRPECALDILKDCNKELFPNSKKLL